MAPPPGVTPNMVNPKSTGPILIIVSSVLQAIMVVFVINRIYTKSFISRKFTWDDGRLPIICLYSTRL